MRPDPTILLRSERLLALKHFGIAISIVSSLVSGIVSTSAQPLFDGADPDVLVDEMKYWIYPTTELKEKTDLYAYSSDDLTSWVRSEPILKFADVHWIDDDKAPEHELWAPAIFREGQTYFLYFAVGPQNPTPSRIGVAVSASPHGPFVDSGAPLITGNREFEAIDPMVFHDTRSGKVYLYCGGSAGPQMRVYELAPDRTHVEKLLDVKTPDNFTEAPFMHRRGDTYYLSYSHGRWNDDTYSVAYSTANSPLGPWTYRGKILETDANHAGPGHHSIFQNPKTGEWFIAYHRWNNAKRDAKMPPGRTVCLDRVVYDSNGLIEKIKMTNEPPMQSSLAEKAVDH